MSRRRAPSLRLVVSASALHILSGDGPVSRLLAGDFEPRPEQLAMARAVAEAMDANTHLLVEAGTGVGKSFAYLVPAILRATRHNQTVLVATNTIALQEQLVEKDIPLLEKALASLPPEEGVRPLAPVLVKGRGNYVSIRRLKLASQRQDRLFSDPGARRSLHQIEDWAYATADGTLSTLPPLERPGVWDKVQSDSGNCMGRKCPHFDQCFFQNARATLDGANLLVTNHALFFSDLALRAQDAGFLPRYDHVILDEAHAVEDSASDHFGVQLAEGRVLHLLSTLYQARTNKGYLPQLELLAGDGEGVRRALDLVDQAVRASHVFFEELSGLVKADDRPGFGESSRPGARPSGRIRQPGIVSNVLTPVMRELSLRLRALKDSIKGEPDKYELNAYAFRAESIAADAETLVSQSLPGYAYWVESSAPDEDHPLSRGQFRRVSLACSPIEVAPILKDRLFDQPHSVVLTSATLSTRRLEGDESGEVAETAFAHTLARLGCEGAKTLQLGSPFDYASQVRLLLDRRAALPREHDPRALPPLSACILEHVRDTGGGAFVLFTSFSALNKAVSDLAGPLAELGLPLLAQGRDGSRAQILARFREDPRSVLFGAASFWQGVDVRGHALRNVIITKLPFDPPDRPLTEARGELIQSRGGDPFLDDSLPRAVIRFKQGFGRLIRSKTDRGRVVVLDPRIKTARYGRQFLRALPEGLVVEEVAGPMP